MKKILKIMRPPCKHKQDYFGVSNDNTRWYDDYPRDTDGCARNIGNEHKNEEGDEYIESISE